jgi:small subunit ribosomal protein S13
MIRIAGTTLPGEKRMEIALTYVYGIGLQRSHDVLAELKIDPNIRAKDISNDDAKRIQDFIGKTYKIEDDLRREVMFNVRRLKEIKSYRGSRHAKGLPARGQRTKTNSRTVRGNRRMTTTSGRKKSAEKT